VPEPVTEDRVKYRDAVRTWLNENYLEKIGLMNLPKVEVTEYGVKVTDLQHICWDATSRTSIDTVLLARVINQLDKLYVETL